MTDYTVKISRQAASDMREIYDYIANNIGMADTAMRQFDRIATAIDTLSYMPKRIKIMSGEYCQANELRQLLVDNYSVIYTVNDMTVYIVRVLYSSTNLTARLQNINSDL